jgi:paraquat-inducible protein A
MALALAALILYLPANTYPILQMEWYGVHNENTIWQGCVQLFQHGQWPVAVIVFLASILVPLLKLLGLFYLSIAKRFWPGHRLRERAWICRALVTIGPWAMLDVFLVAVLVALVKMGELATIMPGPGLLAFTAVVVLTLLASSGIDPWQVWDEADRSA